MTISEKKLAEWAQPLGIREERRCANTVAHIRKAIYSDPILSQKGYEGYLNKVPIETARMSDLIAILMCV